MAMLTYLRGLRVDLVMDCNRICPVFIFANVCHDGLLCVMDHGDQVGTSIVCSESWAMTILMTLGCTMVRGDLGTSMVYYV
jgi:hypothetical protein